MLDFKRKSIELEKNLAGEVKNFHNVDLTGILGIERVKWKEGQNYRFDKRASKLFNNSTTSPTLSMQFFSYLRASPFYSQSSIFEKRKA